MGSTAANLNSMLIAAWNLLLIPAALRLYNQFRKSQPRLLLATTIAGIISFILWAAGGYTHISHTLETIYLILETVWLLGIGFSVVQNLPILGYFTLVVGAFTAVDVIFNLFEPMPFIIYLLAAPKLPLWALWSFIIGVVLTWKAKEIATPTPNEAKAAL